MEFLIIYFGLAVVLSLLCLVLLVMPVFDRLFAEGVENAVTEHKWVCYITSFILGVLAAPIIVIAFTSFDKLNSFRDSLYNELQKA